MKKEYLFIAILYIVVFLILFFVTPLKILVHGVYKTNNLQVPIFSGLLTVGAFLLSMKTFIIFKLKDDVYDHPGYIKSAKESLSGTSDNYDHYRGLKQLSDYLSISIFGSLFGAVLNITVGFIEIPFTSSLCVTVSACTIVLLFFAWYLVWSNLKDWLDILENP